MRPLKIELCGFGPYLNKTEIDLTKLGESGLYLITGNTGTGKSTIFDAISYALYGVSSGSNKKEEMLRSVFATPDHETYVKLEFEHKGKIYTVKRNPTYERRAKKGDGLAKEAGNAYVTCQGMESISGVSAVTQFIMDLIGLEQDQFSQIVMIAQGEFQKILFAGTAERTEIYRKLFKTEKYQNLEESLSKATSTINNELNALKLTYKNNISRVAYDKNNANSILAEKVRDDELPVSDAIQIITKLISEDTSLLEKTEKSLDETKTSLGKVNGELSVLEEKEEKIDTLKKSQSDLVALEANADIFKEALKNAEDNKNSTKEISEKLGALKNKMPQYDTLAEKVQILNSIEKEKTLVENEKQNSEQKLNAIKADEENFKNENTSLENCEVDLAKLNNDIEKLDSQVSSFTELKNACKEFVSSLPALEQAQALYVLKEKELDKKQSLYLHSKKIFMDSQAGILAKTLKEDECCPVCGSLHHPKPAELPDESITSEKFEEIEKQFNEASSNCTNANLEATRLNTEQKAKLSIIQNLYENLFEKKELNKDDVSTIHTQVSNKLSDLSVEKQTLLKNKEKLENNVSRKAELKTLLEKCITDIQKYETSLSSCKEKLAGYDEKINAAKETVSLIKENLEYETQEEAKQQVILWNNQIAKFEKEYEEAKSKQEQNDSSINTLKGIIAQLKKETKDFSNENKNSQLSRKNQLENLQNELQDKITDITYRITTNKEILINSQQKISEIELKEKEFQMVSILSKTANGTIGNGKYKIHLETFVQMTFLDKVIAFANKRLRIMSDKQYDLIRKVEGGSKNSVVGLDIDVIDHYNGGQRSVKTLSGGETFQASLALALGLSDVITNYAGGIKIDSMFIDEGFGTLDTDTLQKAYKALTSITEGNNKTIGIISHVELLKEKIHKQISVSKKPGQSTTIEIIS